MGSEMVYRAAGILVCLFCVSPIISPSLATATYRPIIIIHGVLSTASSMDDLKTLILEAHPGTSVTSIPLYENTTSLEPLWNQVAAFTTAMRPIMQKATSGVILLCYSQGGIMCRGVLQTMADHNVYTFIALSSPLMGQYGDTSYADGLPKLRQDVYKICYNCFGQYISVCDYWNDPHERVKYLSGNKYLAVLNNETANANSQEWKQNFLRIKHLVMIGGPDDGVITPWQSSHFGFYDINLNVVNITEQEVYKRDSFGLRTLHQRNGLTVYSIPGVTHLKWHGNRAVFKLAIEPWLT